MVSAEYRDFLIQASKTFQSRNFCLSRISYLRKEKDKKLSYINKKRHSPLFSYSWRIVLLTISIFAMFMLVSEYKSSMINNDLNKYLLLTCLIAVFTLLALTMFILIIDKIFSDIKYFKKSRIYRKDITEIDTYINNFQNNLNIETQHIIEYNLLPEIYWYAGDVIINYILNMRADTFKEAINLFELELQRNIHFYQQMQMLQSIHTQVKRNANKTVSVFVF